MTHDQAKARLLVVDDDPGIRDLLSRYLGQQGYRVSAVGDGMEMDAWLASHTPDLVILDLMLPGEDGLSLARRLRADGDVPVVMLSARGDEVDRIVGLEVGADDYLAKPFNPRTLSRDFIMEALGSHDRDAFDRSIDVRVTRLRRKIEPQPSQPIYIRTVWGVGYLFAPQGAG